MKGNAAHTDLPRDHHPETKAKPESKKAWAIVLITWVMRIIAGGLFIFSGVTKGLDPWGTIFKFREYFGAWGYEVWDGLILTGVFTLCLVEFITGFCLLFGMLRRTTPYIAFLIMAFMLPLTLWLAVKNPISDCGCFGDAVHLSNWQTFFKNVIITAACGWLVAFNRRAISLITPYLQWIGILFAGLYILVISLIGYNYQPLIDFREYKIGEPLVNLNEEDYDYDEDDLLRFVYEKNGVRQEFSIDDELPDEEDGWTFVERYYAEPEEEALSSNIGASLPAAPVKEKNLRLYTEDGHQDVTDEVIGNGRQIILMMPVLSEVTAAKTWQINSLYEWCGLNDIEMLATVGGNPREIAQWKDISLAEYPIYTSDDTSIEEVVRGNPAVVYLEDGIVKWKSSLKALNIDDFQDESINPDPMSFARNDHRIWATLSWIFAGVTLLLVLLSLFPKLFSLFPKKLRPKNEPVSTNPDHDHDEE